MSSAFNCQILAEKLSKLNSSQQNIESLSSWCITHRTKARQIVQKWEELFKFSTEEKKVSFLYLANDILQNSRRNGSEFVNEFWKVLPGALKSVHDGSEDLGKKVVLRLVGIWDERKVFGSRGQGLKGQILGRERQSLDNNGKSSIPIKVVQNDDQTIRFKLPVGGMPTKIVTAYQCVLDQHLNEDTALNKCEAAIQLVDKREKEFNDACSHGNLQGLPSVKELQEQEATLKQCVNLFGSMEATGAALVARLKEALEEQEMKLELIRSQIQVAQTETEHANSLARRLVSATATTNSSGANGPLLQPAQPMASFTNSSTSSEDLQKKAAAAAMAAKLTASTSSAQMLASVLSSLVAEEAASKNGGLNAGTIASNPPQKRPRLEETTPASDIGNSYFAHLQQPPLPQMQQFVQNSSIVAETVSYSVSMGLARPSVPTPQQPPLPPMQSQQQQQQQQQHTSAGFYQTPGIGFYGQQQAAPPAPRQ